MTRTGPSSTRACNSTTSFDQGEGGPLGAATGDNRLSITRPPIPECEGDRQTSAMDADASADQPSDQGVFTRK